MGHAEFLGFKGLESGQAVTLNVRGHGIAFSYAKPKVYDNGITTLGSDQLSDWIPFETGDQTFVLPIEPESPRVPFYFTTNQSHALLSSDEVHFTIRIRLDISTGKLNRSYLSNFDLTPDESMPLILEPLTD